MKTQKRVNKSLINLSSYRKKCVQLVVSHSWYMIRYSMQKQGFISICKSNIFSDLFNLESKLFSYCFFTGNIKIKYFEKNYLIYVLKTSVVGVITGKGLDVGLVSRFSAMNFFIKWSWTNLFFANNSHVGVRQFLLHLLETNDFNCVSQNSRDLFH